MSVIVVIYICQTNSSDLSSQFSRQKPEYVWHTLHMQELLLAMEPGDGHSMVDSSISNTEEQRALVTAGRLSVTEEECLQRKKLIQLTLKFPYLDVAMTTSI